MLITLALTVAIVAGAQDATPQKLFESGKYQEAIDKVKAGADARPDQVYLRALAHRKLNQNGDAKEAFEALGRQPEDSAWREIGNSGTAMVDGNLDAAADAAKTAVDRDGNSAQARYQLGLVLSARNNQPRNNQPQAAEAFAKAAELDPQMAYAH
jgi:tetratricopeptide (TPR) repeat protein